MALCSLIMHSNTTLVKVKLNNNNILEIYYTNSNTTLVKVKFESAKGT